MKNKVFRSLRLRSANYFDSFKRIIQRSLSAAEVPPPVAMLLPLLLSCHGFDGVFTDASTKAFTAGHSVKLPKAGGGNVLGTMIDVNNDGIPDGIDLNGDGVPEILFRDLVVGQSAGLDLNGDGVADYYLSIDYQGNFYISTTKPAGNTTSGNVTVTTDASGNPTGLNTTGGTTTDDGTLGQIYADATPPTAGPGSLGGTFTGAQTVTLTCADNVACNGIAYTTDGSTPNFSGNGIVSAGNSLQLTIGNTLTLKWIARDANGNVSLVAQSASFTITGDITAPTPGSSGTITATSVTATSLTLNWTQAIDDVTPQGSIQYLAYRSTANNLGGVANIEANGTAIGSYAVGIASVNATGLVPSTTYYFNVIVKDMAGNKAAYATMNTATTADTTAPTPGSSGTISATNVTDTTLTLNWTQATDDVTAQGSLQYLAYWSTSNNLTSVANIEANGTAIGSYSTAIVTVNMTGLTASTTYYFNVIVKDTAGNKAAYTTVNQATTAPPDTTPPTLQSSTPNDTATGIAPCSGSPCTGKIVLVFSESMQTGNSQTLTTGIYNGTSYVSTPNTGTAFVWSTTTNTNDTLTINISWYWFPENSQIQWMV